MKIIYVNNYDSFAGNVQAFTERAVKKYSLESQVKRYTSKTDIAVLKNENPDLIILGPGPSSPIDAGNYLQVLETFYKSVPVFGICLGFQTMMHYFGQPVRVLEEAVHGAACDINHSETSIFKEIKSPAPFGRYHSLGIYTDELPKCFGLLASYPDSNNKNIVMAAIHKSLPIAGVQFHPESILSAREDNGQKLMDNVISELCFKNTFINMEEISK